MGIGLRRAFHLRWSFWAIVSGPFLLSIFLISAVWYYSPNSRTADQQQYLVYSAYLTEVFRSDSLVVIQSRTQSGRTRFNLRRFRFLREKLPGLQKQTFLNFVWMNQEPLDLTHAISLPTKYELVAKKELDDLWGAPDRGYWRRFPDAYGYVALSRVGFNRDSSQALFYIDHFCGLCGGGRFVLMRSVNGRWVVTEEAWTWIS